jgi:hypothetical protein
VSEAPQDLSKRVKSGNEKTDPQRRFFKKLKVHNLISV